MLNSFQNLTESLYLPPSLGEILKQVQDDFGRFVLFLHSFWGSQFNTSVKRSHNSSLTTHRSKFLKQAWYFAHLIVPLHIMKRFLLIILPFLATIFTACTEHGAFERRLAVADSLMTHELPDSAYRMLCGMDAEAEEVSEPLRMRPLLLRSNAQNKAYVDFTSDSIGCLLVNYYDAHGTPNERMLAHYIKGCAYRDMGDQPASLRCYNDAVAAADTSRADCNYDQLSIIYGQIARIFNHRALPDNALQAY